MRARDSLESEEDEEVEEDSEPSSERICPPREEVMSWTTAPILPSLTNIVTFITGSMSVAGAASLTVRRLCDTAARAAIDIAVGVVSGKRCALASSVRLTRVFATGNPLKGPRARAADVPACRACRIPGRER